MFKGKYGIEKFDAYRFIVTRPLSYTTKKGVTHEVPIGFVTDGASIPKIFWSIVGSPFTGLYSEAALIHDYLYCKQKTTRGYADSVFLEAMKELGVSWWKRRAMWTAVRVGGWAPWNKHDKEHKEKACKNP